MERGGFLVRVSFELLVLGCLWVLYIVGAAISTVTFRNQDWYTVNDSLADSSPNGEIFPSVGNMKHVDSSPRSSLLLGSVGLLLLSCFSLRLCTLLHAVGGQGTPTEDGLKSKGIVYDSRNAEDARASSDFL